MTIDLAELKAKAKAATPGPWQLDGHHMSLIIKCIAECGSPNARHLCGDYINVADAGENWMVDAPFIVAANPSVILALLDRLEKAEKQIYSYKEDEVEKPPLGEASYAHQWALDTLSRADDGRHFIWGQRNLSRSYLNLETEVARLRALLARAGRALNEADTWTDEEHDVADWRDEARTIAREIEEAIGHE